MDRPTSLLHRIISWRAPFLPALRPSQWYGLWSLNMLVFGVYSVGRWRGWWEVNDLLTPLFPFLFGLLAFTRLDCSRITLYMIRPVGGGPLDLLPVTRWRAWKLRGSKQWEIHRLYLLNGEVVHGERLQ